MIDIGGPTMIRAAAKNCSSVAVLTSPAQYDTFIAELRANAGAVSQQTRIALAKEAFVATTQYVTSSELWHTYHIQV
jgi:phosphoribosylaminoimidazolecarboxamide formyltransferase/IMP cyclohydrolase